MGRVTARTRAPGRPNRGRRSVTGLSSADRRQRRLRAVGIALEDGREDRRARCPEQRRPIPYARPGRRGPLPRRLQRDARRLPADGTTLKVNLAIDRLPSFRVPARGPRSSTARRFTCCRRDRTSSASSAAASTQSRPANCADFPTDRVVHPHAVDPTLRDERGRHSAAFFVQWVPYQLADGTLGGRGGGYVRHLLELADRFAPGFSRERGGRAHAHPAEIERAFRHLRRPHPPRGQHVRLRSAMPYATPVEGLYLQRRMPPGRVGHRRGRLQRRAADSARPLDSRGRKARRSLIPIPIPDPRSLT